MNKIRPVFLTLEAEQQKQRLGYFLSRGSGGPLLFLWSIGVGLFIIFGAPIFALVWTAAVCPKDSRL